MLISIENRSSDIRWDICEPNHQKIMERNDTRGAIMAYYEALKKDPKEWLIKRLYSAAQLWGPVPPADIGRGPLKRALIGIRFVFFLSALLGSYFLMRDNRTFFLILFGPPFVITTIHILTFSNHRFTFIIEPFVICLAVYGLQQIFQMKKKSIHVPQEKHE